MYFFKKDLLFLAIQTMICQMYFPRFCSPKQNPMIWYILQNVIKTSNENKKNSRRKLYLFQSWRRTLAAVKVSGIPPETQSKTRQLIIFKDSFIWWYNDGAFKKLPLWWKEYAELSSLHYWIKGLSKRESKKRVEIFSEKTKPKYLSLVFLTVWQKGSRIPWYQSNQRRNISAWLVLCYNGSK